MQDKPFVSAGVLNRGRMYLRASKVPIAEPNKAPRRTTMDSVTSTVCWSVPAYVLSSSFHSHCYTSREPVASLLFTATVPIGNVSVSPLLFLLSAASTEGHFHLIIPAPQQRMGSRWMLSALEATKNHHSTSVFFTHTCGTINEA